MDSLDVFDIILQKASRSRRKPKREAMDTKAWQRMVMGGVLDQPKHVQEKLEGVDFDIHRGKIPRKGVKDSYLGWYSGRGGSYGWDNPNINFRRDKLEESNPDKTQLRNEIKRIIPHEALHHVNRKGKKYLPHLQKARSERQRHDLEKFFRRGYDPDYMDIHRSRYSDPVRTLNDLIEQTQSHQDKTEKTGSNVYGEPRLGKEIKYLKQLRDTARKYIDKYGGDYGDALAAMRRDDEQREVAQGSYKAPPDTSPLKYIPQPKGKDTYDRRGTGILRSINSGQLSRLFEKDKEYPYYGRIKGSPANHELKYKREAESDTSATRTGWDEYNWGTSGKKSGSKDRTYPFKRQNFLARLYKHPHGSPERKKMIERLGNEFEHVSDERDEDEGWLNYRIRDIRNAIKHPDNPGYDWITEKDRSEYKQMLKDNPELFTRRGFLKNPTERQSLADEWYSQGENRGIRYLLGADKSTGKPRGYGLYGDHDPHEREAPGHSVRADRKGKAKIASHLRDLRSKSPPGAPYKRGNWFGGKYPHYPHMGTDPYVSGRDIGRRVNDSEY